MTTIVVEPFTIQQAEQVRSLARTHCCTEQQVLQWLVSEAMRRQLLKDFRPADLGSSNPDPNS